MNKGDIKDLRIVKVDGEYYLGAFEKTETDILIKNAFPLDEEASESRELSKTVLRDYIILDDKDELIPEVHIGTSSTYHTMPLIKDNAESFKEGIDKLTEAQANVKNDKMRYEHTEFIKIWL